MCLFTQRLKDGGWSFQNTMPRFGKDKLFDELVDQLGLHENRQYASNKWRKFKKEKGVFRPPSIEADPKKLMMNYRLRIERYTVVKVVADASAELALANAAAASKP
jgi:hypothetical protein